VALLGNRPPFKAGTETFNEYSGRLSWLAVVESDAADPPSDVPGFAPPSDVPGAAPAVGPELSPVVPEPPPHPARAPDIKRPNTQASAKAAIDDRTDLPCRMVLPPLWTRP